MWSAIASIGGGILDNIFGDKRQENAQNFSAEQYAKRYQVQTQDMIKAGLNPMLSVSQGAGASPQSSAATPGSNMTQAAAQILQNKVLEAQARKTNAEANVTEQVGLDQAKATLNQTLAQTGFTSQQISQSVAQTENIIAELQNIKDTNTKIKRAAHLMFEQANLAYQQQLTEAQRYELTKAQVKQVLAQTGLTNLDLQAAKTFDNLGREAGQLKPIFDIMKMFIRR